DPQLLGPIVDKLMAERGWSAPVSMGGVVGRWREIVGDQLADHCQVETFDDAVLVVRADSTAWATQLRLLQPQLERRLAEEVGEGVVQQIVIRGPAGPSWTRGPRSVRGRGPRVTYGCATGVSRPAGAGNHTVAEAVDMRGNGHRHSRIG